MKKVMCILTVCMLLSACGGKKDSSEDALYQLRAWGEAAARARQEGLDRALIVAAMTSDRDKIKELLSKGANINSTSGSFGGSPLHSAVRMNDSDVVEALIEAGADINARDKDGYTPLDWARAYYAFCCDDLLVEHGAEPGEEYEILSVGHNIPKIREQLDRGADINTVDRNGCSLLHYFVLSSANLLNCEDIEPDLKRGMKRGILNNVRELVEKGADPNTSRRSRHGNYCGTPLHDAAAKNTIEIVEILLDAGADLEAHDRFYSSTPLIYAVKNSHREMTDFLLDKGADVSARNLFGRTALHLAAEKAGDVFPEEDKEEVESLNIDIARLLLSWQADINARDDNGKTPLDYAQTEKMNHLLRSYGAKTGKELQENDK